MGTRTLSTGPRRPRRRRSRPSREPPPAPDPRWSPCLPGRGSVFSYQISPSFHVKSLRLFISNLSVYSPVCLFHTFLVVFFLWCLTVWRIPGGGCAPFCSRSVPEWTFFLSFLGGKEISTEKRLDEFYFFSHVPRNPADGPTPRISRPDQPGWLPHEEPESEEEEWEGEPQSPPPPPKVQPPWFPPSRQ